MTEISNPWHIIYFLRISFFKTLWPMQFWYVNPSHALVSFRHFTMACLMFCTLWTVAWLVFCTLWTVAWLAFCTLGTVAWLVFCTVWTVAWIEWVSEWLNLIAFLGTADSEVHIVHMSREITAYTLKSLSSLTQITHNLQTTINFKKKGIEKRTTKKWGHPLSWQIIGEKDSGSVYIVNL